MGVILIFSSCERKSPEKATNLSSAQIKSIMESVHDPREGGGKVNYAKEISKDSLISEWVFDKKGNVVNEKKYNSRGALIAQSIYRYDKRDHLIEVKAYHFKNLFRKTINKFDSQERLIETQTVDDHNELKEQKKVSFDDNGYRIERNYKLIGKDLSLEQEHFYNSKGSNTENRSFSNGKLLFTELNDFDKQGNRVECIRSSNSGKEDFVIQFKYDKLNRNIETVRLNNSFMMQSRLIYRYDEHNNRIESFSYGTTGKLREQITWIYEYDETGNWIRKTTLVGNHPLSVTVRDIIYY